MSNGIVLGGALRCRQSASTSATVLGSFSNGSVISVTSYNDSWYRTTWTNGSTGYVMKEFVAVVGDTVKVTGSNVNVRSGPGMGNSSLYQLSSPTTATVQDMSTGWVKIKPVSHDAGWMSASYLNKHGSGGGNGTVYPGITGNGHNSNVTAASIRANTGKYWETDTSTYHPQIVTLQRKLQDYYSSHLGFSDYSPLGANGIFGNDTYQYVCLYQRYSGHGLAVDGKVGYHTLTCLENDSGSQIT